MTENELNDLYFEWMYQLVCDERYSRRLSYRKLLIYLHSIDFHYTIGLDGNRAEDGIDLRYRFGYEESYEESMISTFLDNHPCSVLEMLVALSIQCEKIMTEPYIGDRTGQWFWNMIVNLKLGSMTDSNFDRKYVNERIGIFTEREYGRDGDGGLFTIKHCKHDLRNVEIWYQMCWYLDSILEK